MRVIKQGSTPTILFLLVSSTNHVSGLATGATPVVYVGKGASGTGSLSSNTATAVDTANLPGWYRLALTATETNTIGDLVVHASATGADDTDRLFVVESNDISGITTDIAAKASQSSVTAIPTNPLLTTDSRLNNLDAQVSTRLATSGYTAPPATVVLAANQTCNITGNLSGSVGSVTGSVGSVTGSVGSVLGAVGSVTGSVGSVLGAVGSVTGSVASVTGSVGSVAGAVASVTGSVGSVAGNVGGSVIGTVTLAASQPNYAPTKTTDLATLATQASVNTVISYIDTEVAAIKAQTDQLSFTTGKVNANATATVDTAAIDAALAAPGSAMSTAHGSGSWLTGSGGGGSSIVIPVITGQPTLIRLTDSVSLQILRGDSYRVTFSLGPNYTGYTGQFAAKLRGADGSLSPTYSIPLRSITWTDITIGAGYVDLTATDTATIGLYTGEIQLTDGTHVRTPKQYTIGIIADIIT